MYDRILLVAARTFVQYVSAESMTELQRELLQRLAVPSLTVVSPTSRQNLALIRRPLRLSLIWG